MCLITCDFRRSGTELRKCYGDSTADCFNIAREGWYALVWDRGRVHQRSAVRESQRKSKWKRERIFKKWINLLNWRILNWDYFDSSQRIYESNRHQEDQRIFDRSSSFPHNDRSIAASNCSSSSTFWKTTVYCLLRHFVRFGYLCLCHLSD
jgi:hypothetical protein